MPGAKRHGIPKNAVAELVGYRIVVVAVSKPMLLRMQDARAMMKQVKMPPSVSGDHYRLPLDHPDVERVGQRLELAYQSENMSHVERCEAIKLYKLLVRVDRYFFNALGVRELPATTIRPDRPDDAQRVSSTHFGAVDMEVRAGFVWRVLEVAEKIAASSDLSEFCTQGDDV